jgi:hypothetical protein
LEVTNCDLKFDDLYRAFHPRCVHIENALLYGLNYCLKKQYHIKYHIKVVGTQFQSLRLQRASRPLPSISRRPSLRHRFITLRIISRLTLGQSRSMSAMPKGPVTCFSAYSISPVLAPLTGFLHHLIRCTYELNSRLFIKSQSDFIS